jgi:predicted nucleic acid-binding protein
MSFEKYIFQPLPLERLIKDPETKVVIDTNVLLAAYQWRKVTTKEIIKALQDLSTNRRLVVPEHIIKEFSLRRPDLIAEMIQGIDQEFSSKFNSPRELMEVVPALIDTDEFTIAKSSRESYIDASKEYRKQLKSLRDKLLSLFNEDHVLDAYKKIFEQSFFAPDNFPNLSKLETEATERFKKKIPPGYKDGGKSDNSAGDYIIWRYMLELNSDVLFVSLDHKPDWVLKSANDHVITARQELIMEFYEMTGKSFRLVSPIDFFPLIVPSLSEEIRKDLTSSVTIKSSVKSELSLSEEETQQFSKMMEEALGYSDSLETHKRKKQNYLFSRCNNCSRVVLNTINGLCAHCNAIVAEDE